MVFSVFYSLFVRLSFSRIYRKIVVIPLKKNVHRNCDAIKKSSTLKNERKEGISRGWVTVSKGK